MQKINLKGLSTDVIVRSAMTAIAAINILLGYMGLHLIPVSDEEMAVLVNGAIVLVTAVVWAWGYWKNNSFTAAAQAADKVLVELGKEEATKNEQ